MSFQKIYYKEVAAGDYNKKYWQSGNINEDYVKLDYNCECIDNGADLDEDCECNDYFHEKGKVFTLIDTEFTKTFFVPSKRNCHFMHCNKLDMLYCIKQVYTDTNNLFRVSQFLEYFHNEIDFYVPERKSFWQDFVIDNIETLNEKSFEKYMVLI